MTKKNNDPEIVRMEASLHFAGRHGTEGGEDPVFDELMRYAADLRECLRTISSCDACNTTRLACNPRAYQRNLDRYNAALKCGRQLLRRKA